MQPNAPMLQAVRVRPVFFGPHAHQRVLQTCTSWYAYAAIFSRSIQLYVTHSSHTGSLFLDWPYFVDLRIHTFSLLWQLALLKACVGQAKTSSPAPTNCTWLPGTYTWALKAHSISLPTVPSFGCHGKRGGGGQIWTGEGGKQNSSEACSFFGGGGGLGGTPPQDLVSGPGISLWATLSPQSGKQDSSHCSKPATINKDRDKPIPSKRCSYHSGFVSHTRLNQHTWRQKIKNFSEIVLKGSTVSPIA